MAVTLFIADLTDDTLATPAVNLNGNNIGFADFTLLHDFDLGSIATEAEWLAQSPVPGAIQTSRRHPVVPMNFRVRSFGTLTEIRAGAEALKLALDAGGVIVFREQDAGPPLQYIDFYPSPLSQLYRGQERSIYKIVHLLDDVDGMPVTVWRHPYIREAQRDASANFATNALLLEDAAADGRPDGWAWIAETNIASHAIAWSTFRLGPNYTFVVSTTGARTLRQVYSGAAVGEEWTFSFEGAGGPDNLNPAGRAVIEFLTSGDVLIGSETAGTLTQMKGQANGWTRAEVTATAPATTAKIRVGIRIEDGSASATTWSLRNAQAEKAHSATPFRVGPELVTNDVTAINGKHLWAYNPGNVPAIAQVRATPDATANLVRLNVARRSGSRDSAEFGNSLMSFLVKVGALSNGTTQPVVDVAATGGTCAETAFTTTNMLKRWRVEVIPSATTALQGRFWVYAAVKAGLASEFQPQLRWGIGDVDDLPYVLTPTETIDTGDALTAEYETFRFGAISIEKGTDGVFMEGWCKRISGSGTLRWDAVWLMPADESFTSAVLPGRQDVVQSQTDSWLGSELVLPASAAGTFDPGEVSGTETVLRPTLTANLQAAGTPPDTGNVLASAIQHTVTTTVTVFEDAASGLKQGELRVYNVTDSAQVVKTNIAGTKGVRWTAGKVVQAVFTPIAGKAYQFYVVYTASLAVGAGNIHVTKIGDTYTPPVVGALTQTIAIDGDTRRVYVREAGQFARPLTLAEGGMVELAPGVNLLPVSTADNPSVGHANPKHTFDRTVLVSVNVIPRHS